MFGTIKAWIEPKIWLIKSGLMIALALAVFWLCWEFNQRGKRIETLKAEISATQATLETERVNHAQTVQAYQAGLDMAAKVSDRRIEVTTRLQKIESEIANAPTTTGCASSPAIRLAVGELRDQAAPDPAR